MRVCVWYHNDNNYAIPFLISDDRRRGGQKSCVVRP